MRPRVLEVYTRLVRTDEGATLSDPLCEPQMLGLCSKGITDVPLCRSTYIVGTQIQCTSLCMSHLRTLESLLTVQSDGIP